MAVVKQAYHHGDLRTALLEAALDVISESGPQALTIREVARRAGVSHAAPYRHFESKDDLILAVVEHGFDLLQESIDQAKLEAGDEFLDQFAASGMAYFSFAMDYAAYYRVMYSGDLLSTIGRDSLQHTSNSAFEQMKGDILACQKMGLVREGDPSLQAVAILSSIHGFVSLANDNRMGSLTDGRYTMDELKDFLLASIFEGIGVVS